jgi:hypothetical protein
VFCAELDAAIEADISARNRRKVVSPMFYRELFDPVDRVDGLGIQTRPLDSTLSHRSLRSQSSTATTQTVQANIAPMAKAASTLMPIKVIPTSLREPTY